MKVLLALFLFTFTVQSNGDTNGETCMVSGESSPSSTCTLYIAESTIPGAGLGIFTTVEKFPGEEIGYGDLCIPLVGTYMLLVKFTHSVVSLSLSESFACLTKKVFIPLFIFGLIRHVLAQRPKNHVESFYRLLLAG